ncbi:hypothetical protein TorRG33x02_017680 [Trema orientale]|uniref:Uncharacterized protein n=1 Tax=Trema orientale TaxID=63057 RepID=A0A2P5FYA9_TREOI|nr:hypothetical protein TorRG33x02_017680 [Trema orientale]
MAVMMTTTTRPLDGSDLTEGIYKREI